MESFWKEYQLEEFRKNIQKAEGILVQAIDSAERANEQMSKWNKDEELECQRKMLAEFRDRTFAFSKEDMPQVEKFKLQHYEMNRHKIKQPFHVISYEFTPTEIGMCATVKCSCGEHLDFFT